MAERMRQNAVYLSVRIANCSIAATVEQDLKVQGIHVYNPCGITPDVPKEQIPYTVARQCYRMMNKSQATVLITTDFGRDCATELGYTFASDKPVYVLDLNPESMPRLKEQLQVHHHSIPENQIFSNAQSLAEAIRKLPQRRYSSQTI